ncbi:MAG: carboxyl transferase domain-containing protein [Clostridia bacterium]|nr:carboxyl transferase domain-containing protein [Clostridia bacterium]MDY5264784.1 carboxyl transferase domain-containing protein [Eubacteriales bacterium]
MNKLEDIDANSKKMLDSSKEIRKFISSLVDENSFVETDVFMAGANYIDGVEALGEGVVTGYAYITGNPVCIIAQNHEVLKGSMSVCHATKIAKTLDRALSTSTPVISIINSNGARLGEGIAVLEGYSKIIRKVNELKGVVPHVAIVKGACVGLMSAYVNACDYVYLSQKDGFISLSAPQVVIAKSGKPAEANQVLGEAVAKNSTAVTFTFKSDKDVCNEIYKLFDLIIPTESVEQVDDPNRLSLKLNKNVTKDELLKALLDEGKYVELFASYATEVVTVIGKVNGITTGVLLTDSTKNDGFISKDGLEKINEFIFKLDVASIPLITLVDSKGVKSTLEDEQKGISILASDVMTNVALSNIPKIAVVVKDAVGFSYSALCSKSLGFDYTLAFVDSYISPLNADTAIELVATAEIKDAKDPVKAREQLQKAYVEDAGNPYVTAKQGFIDNIIEPAVLRPYVISILDMLMGY